MAPSPSDLAHIQEVQLQRLQGGQTSIYFTSVIGGIIITFAVAHWARRIHHRLHLRQTSFGRNLSKWSAAVRRVFYGSQICGFNVLPERVVMAIVYFGVNIGVSVWDIDWHHYTTFANRLGWVSLCNMCLAIILAMKNTPLSPIAGRSYESINVLHRWCGYTTILIMTVHTALYAAGLFATEYAKLLTSPGTIAADVAGIAMILILLTANGFVRRRNYEFFYIAHTILIIVSLITVCYHTSKAARHSLYMALIATSIYSLDKALRFSRFFYYFPSNTATLTPVPSSNATRVTLTRAIPRSAPGSHAFLYIPAIRAFQTHPFTMLSREPATFVISARDGFTKALYEAACEKPGRTAKAGVEGAYGCVPDTTRYERVVLFAGGSGATFAFALAVDWAKRNDVESKGVLELVWSIRTPAQLAGFVPELAILEAHPRIRLHVHVTKASKEQSHSQSRSPPLQLGSEVQVASEVLAEKLDASIPAITIEKAPVVTESKSTPLPAYAVPGRPDVSATVRRVVGECIADDRMLVAACGPTGLSNDVRDAVKECTSVEGPSLTMHLEAFGW